MRASAGSRGRRAIDLEQDKADWQDLPEENRSDIDWGLSSFFVGEERVTTQFSGLVMAYDDQAEEAFLTTQQVDEARHAQHFSRFYEQVMSISGTMDGERLVADLTDREAKVDFVTTYHMVIEGTLALTGQYFITDYFEKQGILPGFLEGFRNISRDEHRHVAHGTWYLKEAWSDPALARRAQDRLSELIPIAAGVLVPRGKDPFGEWDLLGYTSQEVNEFAFRALTRRLKVIGIGLGAPAAA